MALEHKQRLKSDNPDADGVSVAEKAAPEQSAMGAMPALPGLSFDTLNTLQGSIGNAAIGRMVNGGNAATSGSVATDEAPTPVSPDTQDAIDAEISGGQSMAGGVRVHSGPPADNLTKSLNANAFTQGRDVFLGSNAGPDTMTHEMTHVAQGAPASGAVMRQPADTATPASPESSIPAPLVDPESAPGAAMGPEDGEVKYVDRLPTIGEPGIRYIVKSKEMRQAEKRYNFSFTMYDKMISAENLTPADVVQRLKGIWHSYHGDLDYGRAENLRLQANREDHWVVGFWSDTFGGVECPDPDMWNQVGGGPLQAAMQVLESTDAVLEQHWAASEAQTQRNIDPALMNNPYMREALEFDATEQRITEAIRLFEEARQQLIECENKVEEYREGTIKGAGRAITGIKVSIVVLSAAAGGEGAGFAGQGAGLGAKALATAATSGFIGASDEFFTQVGEMRIGEREDWDFDFGKIAKRGVKDTVLAFTGAVVGGKFSSVLGGKYMKWVYGLDEAMLAGQGLTKDMLLNKGEQLVIDWIAGAGASPFNTAAGLAMDKALGEKSNIHSFGDFAGQVWDDMEQGAALDGLLKFAGAGVSGKSAFSSGEGGGTSSSSAGDVSVPAEGGAVSTPMETAVGGGGGSTTTSSPDRTSTSGGDSNGVPEHIGPEGDANLSPDVSTGVPEPIGPGYESTQPQDNGVSGTENTEPVSRPDDAVPEPLGPEADAPLSPDVSTGVPEPIGPGYESTQPQQGEVSTPAVTGTEATQPVASNNGLPEASGPQGDAYYSPAPAVNASSGPTQDAQNGSGGGGVPDGGGGGGRPRRDTLQGMGAAGPAGENVAPRDTQVMDAVDMPGDTETMASQETAGDTQPMPAQERQFSETSELTEPINRDTDNRMSVSGYPGSLPPGYGVFKTKVRIASGAVVDAVVKIYPGENASVFAAEVAAAQAAAATGRGPEFYGQVPVPAGSEARPGVGDLAFAMEPVEGAFAFNGGERSDPGFAKAQAESDAAAARITDATIQDVRDFSNEIIDQGYYYNGEAQGLIGPDGRWRPIDFQGLKPLPAPTDPGYKDALDDHKRMIDDEIENLERARRESEFGKEDPTNH